MLNVNKSIEGEKKRSRNGEIQGCNIVALCFL